MLSLERVEYDLSDSQVSSNPWGNDALAGCIYATPLVACCDDLAGQGAPSDMH
jgi:hypothetical protein